MKLSLASLKVHLAHCAAAPKTSHLIGLIFTASGTPNIVATPGAKHRYEQKSNAHQKLQNWLATREKPFFIADAVEACGITNRPANRAATARVGITLKALGCDTVVIRNNFNGTHVTSTRAWLPPATKRG